MCKSNFDNSQSRQDGQNIKWPHDVKQPARNSTTADLSRFLRRIVRSQMHAYTGHMHICNYMSTSKYYITINTQTSLLFYKIASGFNLSLKILLLKMTQTYKGWTFAHLSKVTSFVIATRITLLLSLLLRKTSYILWKRFSNS